MAASTNSVASPCLRAAHHELAHQRRAGTRRGLVGRLGDATIERGIAGQGAQVLADQRPRDDAEHAIEGRVRHADDAAAIRQHHAFVHDFDGQRLAAQHLFVHLAVRDVVHHADKAIDRAVEVDHRLVGEMNPARIATQGLQGQFHFGSFTATQPLATLNGAGMVGGEEHLPPADAVQFLEGAAEEGLEPRAGPYHLGFAVVVDRRFVNEAGGQLGHGAIAEFALSQRIGCLLAFGDVHHHAHQARELAGRRIRDGAILDLHPAELAVGPANFHDEFHGLAGEVTLHARDAGFFPSFADVEALPASAPEFFFAAAIDTLGAQRPFELVDAAGVHCVLVHGAGRQIGNRAVARVIQQQDAFVGLAPGDVARMCNDAHHGRIAERVDRDAFQPAPAAITVAEAVLEAVQILGRDLRGEHGAKSLAHGIGIVGVQELGGIAA